MVRDWVFKQWWRITRARNVLSIFFWVFTLVGVWAPYLHRYLGTSMSTALLLAFIAIAVAIFAVGYVWDKLEFWRYETRESMIRTYVAHRPTPKERNYAWPLHLAVAQSIYRMTGDPELKRAIERVKRWLDEEH